LTIQFSEFSGLEEEKFGTAAKKLHPTKPNKQRGLEVLHFFLQSILVFFL
jgi:hypothetical protein